MIAYTIRRLLLLIPVLFGMTLIVFFMIRAIPGDPAQVILGTRATPAAIAQLHHDLGLDKPWFIQYIDYLKQLIHGNLGVSLRSKAPINSEIWGHLAATAELSICAMIIAVVVGINAGILSAWKQNSLFDIIAMLIALIGVSLPVFWLGLEEQWAFANPNTLQWFPTSGQESLRDPVNAITGFYLVDTLIQGDFGQFGEVLKHLVLPSIALGTIPMAIIARMTRSSMLEVMRSDYIRTARAKGQSMIKVVYKHAFRNAFIPVLTIIGLQSGLLLGGAILTETIFAWPGVGTYIYDAIQYRDYPVIQAGILVIAFIFVIINLIVDLLYSFIDPRIKYR